MKYSHYSVIVLLLSTVHLYAQDSTRRPATLQQCVSYALNNHASVRQAVIDEEIGKRDIASSLSGWFPQIGADANYNYNVKIPTTAFNGQVIAIGTKHSSALVLQADQKIIDPALLQATKAARYVRLQNAQNTEQSRINLTVEVSKAFYDILTNEEQVKIHDQDITRQKKQFSDSKGQFEAGTVDKTDVNRAEITLYNTEAEKKRTQENLKYKYAYLKELMGLEADKPLQLAYNVDSMEVDMLTDTSQTVSAEKRIEYQQLLTQQKLQALNTSYNKWMYLPVLSASYNYGWDWRTNDGISNLYNASYPRSVFALTLSVPIFQGTKRIQEIRKSQLQEKRIDLDIKNLKNQINTQYEKALAQYTSSMNDWIIAKRNVGLSNEVYRIIKRQYDEGVKSYLDLMTAETDLRTTQINYLNAMYTVLTGKLDLQQAQGNISYK